MVRWGAPSLNLGQQMLRAFLKDSAIYAIPTVASRGLALFLIPLYTRVLSPADYGSLDLFMAFAGIVALTVGLEVHQAVARFYQQEPSPERKMLYASSAFWLSLLNNSIFAVIALAFLPSIAPWIMGREGLETAFAIGIAQIWITSVLYMVQGQLRWQLRSVKYAIVSLVLVSATAVISVWTTVFLGWGLVGFMLGNAVGTVPACLLGLWWSRDSIRFRVNISVLVEMLRYSVPLVVSSIAVWLNLYVDRMMINRFLSIGDVGLYGIAYRFAAVSSVMMIAFQTALTPLIYAHFNDPNAPRELARLLRYFAFLALAFCLALSIFAIDVLTLMTTPEYYASAPTVAILAPATLLSSMYVFTPGIAIAKKTHLMIWINVCGAIFNVVLTLTLIPLLGVNGAAIATLATSSMIFSSYVILGQLHYPIPYDWRRLGLTTGLAISLGVICWWLATLDFNRWITGLAALVIYAIGAVSVGLIHLGEIKAGYRATSNVLARLAR